MASSANSDAQDTISLAVNLVSAYVKVNKVKAEDLVGLLQSVHNAVCGLANGKIVSSGGAEPAVPVSKSITHDHIICLEDGKKLRMLKRYLRTQYDLSPEDYRRKWGLPADYPMSAPAYSARRSQLAKASGLGRAPEAGQKARAKTARRKRAQKGVKANPHAD